MPSMFTLPSGISKGSWKEEVKTIDAKGFPSFENSTKFLLALSNRSSSDTPHEDTNLGFL